MTTFRYRLAGYSEVFSIQARTRYEALQAIAHVFAVDGCLPLGVVTFVA